MQSTEPDTTTLSHTEEQDTAKKGERQGGKSELARQGGIKGAMKKAVNEPAGWGEFNKGAKREE